MEKRKTEKYRISAKFSNFVLCPEFAIDASFWKRTKDVDPVFVTTDGVECEPEFQMTFDSGEVDSLDLLCQKKWGVPFASMRSFWLSRLDKTGNYWHLIKLIKVL